MAGDRIRMAELLFAREALAAASAADAVSRCRGSAPSPALAGNARCVSLVADAIAGRAMAAFADGAGGGLGHRGDATTARRDGESYSLNGAKIHFKRG
jgi:hypothetical protein